MAHITGGGLARERAARCCRRDCRRASSRTAWTRPAIFDWLQRHGNVADDEMHRVFNCGIGMAVVVAAEHADRALQLLDGAGERATRIGTIVAQPAGEPATVVV